MGKACGTDGEKENVYRILANKSEGKDHLEDLGKGGRLILKWREPIAISCLHDN
jgi:hypothetical protein